MGLITFFFNFQNCRKNNYADEDAASPPANFKFKSLSLLLEEFPANDHSPDFTRSGPNFVEFGISKKTSCCVFIYITVAA